MLFLFLKLFLKAFFYCMDQRPFLHLCHSPMKSLCHLSSKFPNIQRNIIGKEFCTGTFLTFLILAYLNACMHYSVFCKWTVNDTNIVCLSCPITHHYWMYCFFDAKSVSLEVHFFLLRRLMLQWLTFIGHYLNTVSRFIMNWTPQCTSVFRRYVTSVKSGHVFNRAGDIVRNTRQPLGKLPFLQAWQNNSKF